MSDKDKSKLANAVKDFIALGSLVVVATLMSSTTASPKLKNLPHPDTTYDSVQVKEFIQTIDSLKYYINKYEEVKSQGVKRK